MSCQVRFTSHAREDLKRLYGFLLEQDIEAAARALGVIGQAFELLKTFPFTCRKIQAENPFLREMVISFGANGYVALFEIEDSKTVTTLAVRHQCEDDYR